MRVGVCALAMLVLGGAASAADESTAIFDGQTLTGWKQLGGAADYKVIDGAIVGSSRPGVPNSFLVTEKTWGDFWRERPQAWAEPDAALRLKGLASRMPGDPESAPDLLILADRRRQLTYANKRDWRVIEGLKVENHRHFRSDHGHLLADESVVPMIFMFGSDPGTQPHASICHASIVDITPTILDMLGLLDSFDSAMAARPSGLRGHSLKSSLERVMEGRAGDETLCEASLQ